MSSLTDEQKKRIEENRRKALEKLQNKSSKPSTSFSPIEKQRPCPSFGLQSSKPETSSNGNTSTFYNKSFTDALKKAQFNKTNALGTRIQNKSTSTGNSNVSAYPKGYCSPPKGSINTSNSPKGSKWNANNTPKIHLILSMKNPIWFKVDHNSRHQDAVKTVAQKIQIRQFDNCINQWCFHIKDYKAVIDTFQSELNVSIEHIPENVVNILQNAHRNHDTYKNVDLSNIGSELLEKLMAFQKEGIQFGIQRKGRVLLADDMGLGKTVQAICISAYYKDEWPVLVICPSSVKMSWQQHFISWIEDVEIEDINIVNCGKDDPTLGKINIISYDLASKLVGKIHRKQFKIIIADECHFLKNHNAGRTKNIVPLLQGTSHALLLSGTPALSRPRELFTQLKALDKNLFPEYHKFSIRYCDGKQTPYGWVDTGSSNDSELHAVLTGTLMIRRMKHEVLHELPEKQRQIVILDPSMIKNTKSLMSDERMFLDAKTEKRSALLHYFQKTCEAKITGVREYVSEKLESGCKIIVFAHHMTMLDAVEETAVLKRVEYIRMDGTTNQKHRQGMIDSFNDNDKCLLAILSLTACGTGLNVTGSSNVIFAELYWNPGHLKQAEDRVHRIGQKNSVLITYLVAKKTADDYIWPMVQHKLKVLTSLGVGQEKGFSGKTTNQDDSRQKKILDFLEMLIGGDDKDFIDQIDKMQGESNGQSEVKVENYSDDVADMNKKSMVTSNDLISDLIPDDLFSDDLFSDDLLSDDLLTANLGTDNLVTDNIAFNVSDEPASKKSKIS